MKRANGSGGIRKQSGKRRKPFAVIITDGWNEEGVQIQKTIGYFAKRSEAETFLADYQRDPSIARKTPPFSEFYIRLIHALELEEKSDHTIRMYNNTYRYFEKIAHLPIDRIKVEDLNEIVRDLKEQGLSYSTTQKVKVLATQVMKLAMEEDYISKNYGSFIKLPAKKKADKTIFTDQEIEHLFQHAKMSDWAKMIVIMIYTAMRPGELLSILKFNVHLDKRYMIGGLKTEAGKDRIIPLHHRIIPHVEYFMNLKS